MSNQADFFNGWPEDGEPVTTGDAYQSVSDILRAAYVAGYTAGSERYMKHVATVLKLTPYEFTAIDTIVKQGAAKLWDTTSLQHALSTLIDSPTT